jgi:NAD(P)-dependent dehydrogenase (short-subunit alcohol dehydrogenase family)
MADAPTACVVDVTRPEDLRQLVTLAVEQFGRLDALVATSLSPSA